MKTNKLVQGAMIAALFGVMGILNTITGSLFDVFLGYVMVVPLVWYGYHNGIKNNLIVSLVSVLVVMILGQLMFTIITIQSCATGAVIAECLRRKKSEGVILLFCFIISFIANILIYEVFAGLLGIDMVAQTKEMYNMMIDMMPAIKNQISLDTMLSFIPLMIMFISALESYVVLLFTQAIMTRFLKTDIEFPGNFHIAFLRVDKRVGLLMIAVFVISQLAIVKYNTIVVRYINMIAMFSLMVVGMSFIAFYMIISGKQRLSGIVLFLPFLPVMNMICVMVGILDIICDFKYKIMYNSGVIERRDEHE